MDLTTLKERSSFIYGDLDLPTPGKLCLIKLTSKYLERSNRKFDTKYIVGELTLINKKPHIYWHSYKHPQAFCNREISCTWSNNIVEAWYYLEDIELKLKEIK
jgi:hypothetical protein